MNLNKIGTARLDFTSSSLRDPGSVSFKDPVSRWPFEVGRREHLLDWKIWQQLLLPPIRGSGNFTKEMKHFCDIYNHMYQLCLFGAKSANTVGIESWTTKRKSRKIQLSPELEMDDRKNSFKLCRMGVLRRPKIPGFIDGRPLTAIGLVTVPKSDGTRRLCMNVSVENEFGVSLNSLIPKEETTIDMKGIQDIAAQVLANEVCGKMDFAKFFYQMKSDSQWLPHAGVDIDDERFVLDALFMGRADAVRIASGLTEAFQYILRRWFPKIYHRFNEPPVAEKFGLSSEPTLPGYRYKGKFRRSRRDPKKLVNYKASQTFANIRGKAFNQFLWGCPRRRLAYHYVDDQDFCGRTTCEVWTMLDIAQFMSTNAICGIPTENMKKLEPPNVVAKLQGWGADFGAKALFVPEDKQVNYLNTIDLVLKAPANVSVALLSILVGRMEFVAQLHRQMKPLFNVLYIDMKEAIAIALGKAKESSASWGLSELKRFARGPRGEQLVVLSKSSLKAVAEFREILKRNEPVPAVELVRTAPFHCNLSFVSDASYEGIGMIDLVSGFCWNIGFGTSFHLSSLGVSEDIRARRFPIACLEALAAYIILEQILRQFEPKTDSVANRPFALGYQDNQNWNSVMNRLRGKGCLMAPAVALTRLLCKHNALLKSLYVPSDYNIADGLTRAKLHSKTEKLYKRYYPRNPELRWGKPLGWCHFFKAWRLLFPLEADFRFSLLYRNMEITAFCPFRTSIFMI